MCIRVNSGTLLATWVGAAGAANRLINSLRSEVFYVEITGHISRGVL